MALFLHGPLDKKRPILIFAYHFMPRLGGIQKYSYELTRSLHKLGYTLIVLAGKVKGDEAFDENQPFRIVRMKGVSLRFLRVVPMLFYFIFTVLRYRIRIVHCINWIPCGFVARLFRRALRYRYIVTCHGGEITSGARWPYRPFLLSSLKRASWIIAGNNFIREKLNQLPLGGTPISVIGFGVDPDFFRPDLDAEFLRVKYGSRAKKTILTVAELKKRKGVDTVLDALHLLRQRGQDRFLYLVVGEGPEKAALVEKARALGLSDSVIFTGAIPDKDLRFHYCICDMFVMMNREERGDVEGFGIVFLEAAAAEKPSIGGRSGGVPDSIAEGKSGFLVDPVNAGELAEKILALSGHPDEALEMGRFARQRAVSLFSWPAIAGKTEMIYDKIFAKKRPR
jgi:phosphatidylinositol alpha-1,6-mannosyltransferase